MRFPLAVLATVLAAYAIGFYLAVPANPEVQFWREVVERRDREIAQVRKEQPNTPIIFFTGGSSCAFSIDPTIIEDVCGLPAFNLGLPVAAGGQYLIHQAFKHTTKNDILVICLEPDLLTASKENHGCSKFSFALSTATGRPSEAAGGRTFSSQPQLREYFNFSRPGAGYLATLIAKILTRRDAYRYTHEDFRERGRVETQIHDPSMKPAGPKSAARLSVNGRTLLQAASDAASLGGVRLLYSMPWHFTQKQHLEFNRDRNLQILQDISTNIPVIDDGFTGAAANPDWFSDSPQHLTSLGSAIRSKNLGTALRPFTTVLPPHQPSTQ